MSTKSLTFIFGMILSYTSFAQTPKIDSLRTLSIQQENIGVDSTLCKNLHNLGAQFYRLNVDSFFHYMERTISCAEQTDDHLVKAKAHFNMGQRQLRMGDYDKGFQNAELCLASNPPSKMEGICIRLKGRVCLRKREYAKASKFLNEAQSIALERKDSVFLGKIYNDFAILYDFQQDFEQSISYHLKSGAIDKENGNMDYYSISLMNIVALYIQMNNPEKALEYLEERKQYLKPDDAIAHMGYHERLGGIFANKKDYPLSVEHFKKARSFCLEGNLESSLSIICQGLSLSLFELKEFEEANKFNDEAKKHAKTPAASNRANLMQARLLLAQNKCQEARMVLDDLDEEMKKEKDFSLLMLFNKVKTISYSCLGENELFKNHLDSTLHYQNEFYLKRKEKEANKIEAEYKFRIKEDSIKILNYKHQEQKNTIQNKNLSLIFGLLVAALLGLLAFYYKKFGESQKKVNDLLELENQKLVFENNELQEINEKLKNQNKQESSNQLNKEIEVAGVDKICIIALNDLKYMIAEDEGVRMHINGQNAVWTKMSLKNVMKLIDQDNFVQIFRGIVINKHYVFSINSTKLKMKDGTELKMSRKYKPQILKRFNL